MEKPSKHMIITVFMAAAGYYKEAWRLPGSRAEELGRLSLVSDLANMAEAAKIDSIFFGDILSGELIRNNNINSSGLTEPISVLSALAAKTQKIGLSGTVSTQFSFPFQTARQFNGLDQLSGGRAGWNIVTSFMGSENFGLDQLPPAAERYRRADEFVDIACQLWDSWSDEAVICDRENGQWVDPEKVQPTNHEGEFYKVAGPLNMRRSPQGRPVLFQAGQSPDGMKLGAKYADGIYTTQTRMEDSIATIAQYRALLEAEGRHPDSLKVLPGLMPILGETKKDAEDYEAELASNIDFLVGKEALADKLNINLGNIDIDDSIPEELWVNDGTQTSRWNTFRSLALDDGYTIRQMVEETYRAGGHRTMVGTASEIADSMIEWFENKACHGFNLNPPSMPEGMRRICQLLIPELQNRGYFREEYEGNTLRDHLGLNRPDAWDIQR